MEPGTVPNGRVSVQFELDRPVGFADHELRDRALGIDPAELIALVRDAGAVEGPRVTGAYELVAGDVANGQIVVEVRAASGRTAEATVGSPPHHVFLVGDIDGLHFTTRERCTGHAHRHWLVNS